MWRIITGLVAGGVLYLFSEGLLELPGAGQAVAVAYMAATGLGYLLVVGYGTQLSRLIRLKLSDDIFNDLQ